MAEAFPFELVSPEKLLVSGDVSSVLVPGTEGYFEVLANHAPFMSTIMPGVVEVKMADGKLDKYIVYGGFADVSPNGVSILAESSVHIDDFDKNDLQSRIEKAEKDVEDATAHHSKSAAMDFLDKLITLDSSVTSSL